MGIPANGDIFLLTYKGTLCNQTILSTWWLQLLDKGTSTTVVEVEDDLVAKLAQVAGLTDKYLAVCPDNYDLDEIWVQKIKPVRLLKARYPQALSGTSGFTAPNANSAWAIERRGELATRDSVGGLHGPLPVDGAVVSGGLITNAGYKTDMGDLANSFKGTILTPFKACNLQWVIYNPRGVNPFPRPVIQTTPFYEVRTAHRRTVGLGI